MVSSEEIADFEAADIPQLIASRHQADWARVTDVHREIKVVHGRQERQYMMVHWLAQNGHLISGEYEFYGNHDHGFSEDQLIVLGKSSLAREIEYREAG